MNAKVGNLASRTLVSVLLGTFLTSSLPASGEPAAGINEQQIAADVSSTDLETQTGIAAVQSGSSDQSDNSGIMAPGSGDGGVLSFQADLYTGRFTYTVPIVAAPGRQGAQPTLALGYNSAGGNGWCGVGWSLETAYIQRDVRKGAPIQWNPNSSPTPLSQYDDSKGFVANIFGGTGPLVCVSATNQIPVIYRQQVDKTFMTFNYYSTNNHWEVVDKNGNTFYFGEGGTNRMENPKTGWTAGVGASTFRWALNKVVDANGNLTILKYTTDGGALYLTNISYNGNINSPSLATTHTVDFILTNRPDTNITFVSGYRVTLAKRLSEIQIKANGLNVRKYVLNYIASPSTTRSLLSSVTQYGSDFATALPPLSFNYQVKPFEFGPDTNMGGIASEGQTTAAWNSIRAFDANNHGQVTMIDIDGDGLPDRVMRPVNSPYNSVFTVERNTGTNFVPGSPYFTWGPLGSQGETGQNWNSTTSLDGDSATFVDLLDINGDGYPDRVMRNDGSPYTNFVVEFNSGFANGYGAANSLSSDSIWPGVTNVESSASNWGSVRTHFTVDLVDMNGDGFPDRVSRKVNGPYDRFKVQLNTGNRFLPPVDWNGVDNPGAADVDWRVPSHTGDTGNYYVMLADINGDGLPDRVMRNNTSPFTKFVVQFNNGAGFEAMEDWGPVDTQGNNGDADWGTPIGSNGNGTRATLNDINGDGLPDRVMRRDSAPYTNWVVQLNTGSGFGPTNSWGPIDSQSQPNDTGWNCPSFRNGGAETVVDLIDINGDGLPDRVMRSLNSPYDHLVVQTNKGPFPDLLCTATNGMGGALQVTYAPSTSVDNRNTNYTGDPWTAGTRSLLPLNVWVVSQISVFDGFGDISTSTYGFKGGYWNAAEREFRGFAQAEVVDPLGTLTRTYFHQSGGRDNSGLGEYADQGSEAKKGIPFRIELIAASSGATNKITLNKVEEVLLHSNGWYFPFVSQTIVMNFEGLSSYRATAKQLKYDTNSANLTAVFDLGEVTNVVFNGQTFTDVGSDSLYTWTSYSSLGNILNRPSDVKITSDSSGTQRLRETLFFYDGHGNLTTNQAWLDSAGAFITSSSIAYDQYGNPIRSVDAAGIVTTNIYDSTYQQFLTTRIVGTFTNSFATDIRSGATVLATDQKGLVASNSFDVLYRPTVSYISTNAYGTPTLWKTKTSYTIGGVVSGISSNCIHKQVNDATDANGYETFSYMDGLGRVVQNRAEAETGQYRVSEILYDQRGKVVFQSLPFFSSGSAFTAWSGTNLGNINEYDGIGRAYRVTPAIMVSLDGSGQPIGVPTGGDVGSPVGPTTTAFYDGSNPWATVVTDSEGKVKKSYRDSRGSTVKVTELTVSGSYDTSSAYDLLGNITNIIDNAGNVTRMSYDSLGRKTSVTDPDMGTWVYAYDNVGRITQQTDARTNRLKFYYNDQIGRLSSREIYDSSSNLVATITYYYDSNYGDSSCNVLKGQLYAVVDREGWETYSYDVRGRTLAKTRYVNYTATSYTSQTTYDDGDHMQTFTYPNGVASLKYSYDTGGNLTQIRSLSGTGTQEVFYAVQGFSSVGQITGYTNGNGVVTTYSYYPNSKRIQNVITSIGGTNHQNLTYSYSTNSNLKSIWDRAYAGSQSAGLTNITYDDLSRVVSLNSTARGVKTYSYSSIGNILTNADAGAGLYSYGLKPHAVTNANGKAYAYDACGNMTSRGGDTLTYDEENHLQTYSGSASLQFGYSDSGARLFKVNGNTGIVTVWVDGIYDEPAWSGPGTGRCHVFAGGKRICTFQPTGGGPWTKVLGEKRYYAWSLGLTKILDWPLQGGRGPFAMLALTFAGIIGIWFAARRHVAASHVRYPISCSARLFARRSIAFFCIASFILASSPTYVEAQTYTPVFYYYHSDHLGSSNVLTDRHGIRVQHYEYSTFGQTTFTDNSSAFPVSNRYTGQVIDDESGLCYYNARYYDPGLGRFIQPDTLVQSTSNPQHLNRYSYCENNPVNAIDPSGHFGIIVGIIVGAIVGAITAAATGGDVGMGALTGAIGGLIGGLGGILGGAIGGTVGGVVGAAVGGAASGAINAAITGGDVGYGALVGGISGVISFGVGQINLPSNYVGKLAGYALSSGGGALGGGIGSEIAGGSFGDGAASGAIGGALAYPIVSAAQSIARVPAGMSELDRYFQHLAQSAYNTDGGFPDGVRYEGRDGFSATFTPAHDGYPNVVAVRGTEWTGADWKNNIQQALGFRSSQYAQAMNLARDVYQVTGGNVVFVGHSLGGGLATAMAAVTGGRAVTFNAAGFNSFRTSNVNVRNFYIRGEVLTTLQALTPLPSAWGTQIPYMGLHDPFSGHGIGNFQ
jgi:RHS repeat-associated protein